MFGKENRGNLREKKGKREKMRWKMRKISVGELTSSCREFPKNGKNGIHPLPAKLADFGNCQAVNYLKYKVIAGTVLNGLIQFVHNLFIYSKFNLPLLLST